MKKWLIKIVLLLASLFIGNFGYAEKTKEIRKAVFNYQGDKVFFIEDWTTFIMIHPTESSKLCFGETDFIKRKALSSTRSIDEFRPNPKNNLIVFNNFDWISLINADTGRIYLKKNISTSYIGWHPSGDYFYFTDEKGIQLYRKDGQFERTLLKKERADYYDYCLGWNPEGDRFIFAHNGWLGFFNTLTNEWVITSEKTGYDSNIDFLPGGVFFIHSFYRGDNLILNLMSLTSGEVNLLYSTEKIPYTNTQRRVAVLETGEILVFQGQRLTKLNRNGVLKEFILDKGLEFLDYHILTNQVIVRNYLKKSIDVQDLQILLEKNSQTLE